MIAIRPALVAVALSTVLAGVQIPVAASSPAHNFWTQVAAMPAARFEGAAAGDPVNGFIYYTGGLVQFTTPDASTFAYSTTADQWTTVAPMPQPLYAQAEAVGIHGLVYVMGGISDTSRGFGLNELYAYSPKRNVWITEPSMTTARDGSAAATGPDGRIYAISGFDDTGADTTNSVEAFNPTTSTWTTVAPIPTPRANLAAVTGPDGRIYAIGGEVSNGGGGFNPTNVVEAYDVHTNAWTQVANVPSPGFACAARASNGRIYAVAESRTSRYRANTNTWTRAATAPLRVLPACASVPSQPHIYMLGGFAGGGAAPEVFRYTT